MRFFHSHIVRPIATALFTFTLVVMATTVSMVIGGCAADSTDHPSIQDNNGVTIIGEIDKEVNSGENTITRAATTTAGYTTSCDAEWVAVTTNATASEAGKYPIKIYIEKNSTGETRQATVNIIVDGFEQTPLVNITQLAIGSKDPIITWIDERLMSEYLWLDEYNQKRSGFDYSLKYDDFLEETLLSLTTNIEDGGYEEDGERYLYSTIENLGTDSEYLTRATQNQRKNYGLEMSAVPIQIASGGQAIALAVDNVFLNSPADRADIERGDWIISVNNAEITISNYKEMWEMLQYPETSSVMVTWRTAFNEDTATASLQWDEVVENPVACSQILDLSAWPEFAEKKVGYLAYTSFNSDFRKELVGAFSALQAEGVTDMIIDLTANGGGEVYTSNYMVSMILDQSYVGSLLGTLDRHDSNPLGDTEMLIEDKTNDTTPITLPHLSLDKVYILTTRTTASASEAVIAGLRGLDFEVVVVGESFTEGKNCGMDVQTQKINTMWYRFSPITFYMLNAKGWNDYADGIPADIDIATLYNPADIATSSRALLYSLFPLPIGHWDNIYFNIPLQAALIDMIGGDPSEDFFRLNEIVDIDQMSQSRDKLQLPVTLLNPIEDMRQHSRSMYVTPESIEAAKREDK